MCSLTNRPCMQQNPAKRHTRDVVLIQFFIRILDHCKSASMESVALLGPCKGGYPIPRLNFKAWYVAISEGSRVGIST